METVGSEKSAESPPTPLPRPQSSSTKLRFRNIAPKPPSGPPNDNREDSDTNPSRIVVNPSPSNPDEGRLVVRRTRGAAQADAASPGNSREDTPLITCLKSLLPLRTSSHPMRSRDSDAELEKLFSEWENPETVVTYGADHKTPEAAWSALEKHFEQFSGVRLPRRAVDTVKKARRKICKKILLTPDYKRGSYQNAYPKPPPSTKLYRKPKKEGESYKSGSDSSAYDEGLDPDSKRDLCFDVNVHMLRRRRRLLETRVEHLKEIRDHWASVHTYMNGMLKAVFLLTRTRKAPLDTMWQNLIDRGSGDALLPLSLEQLKDGWTETAARFRHSLAKIEIALLDLAKWVTAGDGSLYQLARETLNNGHTKEASEIMNRDLEEFECNKLRVLRCQREVLQIAFPPNLDFNSCLRWDCVSPHRCEDLKRSFGDLWEDFQQSLDRVWTCPPPLQLPHPELSPSGVDLRIPMLTVSVGRPGYRLLRFQFPSLDQEIPPFLEGGSPRVASDLASDRVHVLDPFDAIYNDRVRSRSPERSTRNALVKNLGHERHKDSRDHNETSLPFGDRPGSPLWVDEEDPEAVAWTIAPDLNEYHTGVDNNATEASSKDSEVVAASIDRADLEKRAIEDAKKLLLEAQQAHLQPLLPKRSDDSNLDSHDIRADTPAPETFGSHTAAPEQTFSSSGHTSNGSPLTKQRARALSKTEKLKSKPRSSQSPTSPYLRVALVSSQKQTLESFIRSKLAANEVSTAAEGEREQLENRIAAQDVLLAKALGEINGDDAAEEEESTEEYETAAECEASEKYESAVEDFSNEDSAEEAEEDSVGEEDSLGGDKVSDENGWSSYEECLHKPSVLAHMTTSGTLISAWNGIKDYGEPWEPQTSKRKSWQMKGFREEQAVRLDALRDENVRSVQEICPKRTVEGEEIEVHGGSSPKKPRLTFLMKNPEPDDEPKRLVPLSAEPSVGHGKTALEVINLRIPCAAAELSPAEYRKIPRVSHSGQHELSILKAQKRKSELEARLARAGLDRPGWDEAAHQREREETAAQFYPPGTQFINGLPSWTFRDDPGQPRLRGGDEPLHLSDDDSVSDVSLDEPLLTPDAEAAAFSPLSPERPDEVPNDRGGHGEVSASRSNNASGAGGYAVILPLRPSETQHPIGGSGLDPSFAQAVPSTQSLRYDASQQAKRIQELEQMVSAAARDHIPKELLQDHYDELSAARIQLQIYHKPQGSHYPSDAGSSPESEFQSTDEFSSSDDENPYKPPDAEIVVLNRNERLKRFHKLNKYKRWIHSKAHDRHSNAAYMKNITSRVERLWSVFDAARAMATMALETHSETHASLKQREAAEEDVQVGLEEVSAMVESAKECIEEVSQWGKSGLLKKSKGKSAKSIDEEDLESVLSDSTIGERYKPPATAMLIFERPALFKCLHKLWKYETRARRLRKANGIHSDRLGYYAGRVEELKKELSLAVGLCDLQIQLISGNTREVQAKIDIGEEVSTTGKSHVERKQKFEAGLERAKVVSECIARWSDTGRKLSKNGRQAKKDKNRKNVHWDKSSISFYDKTTVEPLRWPDGGLKRELLTVPFERYQQLEEEQRKQREKAREFREDNTALPEGSRARKGKGRMIELSPEEKNLIRERKEEERIARAKKMIDDALSRSVLAADGDEKMADAADSSAEEQRPMQDSDDLIDTMMDSSPEGSVTDLLLDPHSDLDEDPDIQQAIQQSLQTQYSVDYSDGPSTRGGSLETGASASQGSNTKHPTLPSRERATAGSTRMKLHPLAATDGASNKALITDMPSANVRFADISYGTGFSSGKRPAADSANVNCFSPKSRAGPDPGSSISNQTSNTSASISTQESGARSSSVVIKPSTSPRPDQPTESSNSSPDPTLDEMLKSRRQKPARQPSPPAARLSHAELAQQYENLPTEEQLTARTEELRLQMEYTRRQSEGLVEEAWDGGDSEAEDWFEEAPEDSGYEDVDMAEDSDEADPGLYE